MRNHSYEETKKQINIKNIKKYVPLIIKKSAIGTSSNELKNLF